MIKLLRNREVSVTLIIFAVISCAVTVFAFFTDLHIGIAVAVACVLFTAVYLISTYARYKRIADLSSDINKILHGSDEIALESYKEGELGILGSEIYKMTVRLREQRALLQKEKVFLSDQIADISHQIRTPLTSVNLLVSFLSEPDITEERRLQLTHELYGMLSRIDWLITSLLKMSRLDAGTVTLSEETVTAEELIKKASAPLLIPMELKKISFPVIAEGSLLCDIQWTSEALANIIKNCIEHTADGGEITVTAEETPLFTEITVTDTGTGIPEEDIPRIFERFYKGKNSSPKSFGIGLALARTVITAQNGTVKVKNNDDRGVTFTVRFYKGTV